MPGGAKGGLLIVWYTSIEFLVRRAANPPTVNGISIHTISVIKFLVSNFFFMFVVYDSLW